MTRRSRRKRGLKLKPETATHKRLEPVPRTKVIATMADHTKLNMKELATNKADVQDSDPQLLRPVNTKKKPL